MIEHDEGNYYLVCDNCGEYAGPFKSFYEAKDYGLKNGWLKRLDKENGWTDYCPECTDWYTGRLGGI